MRNASRILFGSALLLGLPLAAAALDCPPGTERSGAAPPDGHREWCVLPDGVQHGPSHSYYSEGARLAQATFEHGRLTGAYQEWHPNGRLKLEGHYRSDEKDGKFAAFYPDGTKKWEEGWRAGVQHGPARSWHPNGNAMGDMSFTEGRLHGPARTWYSSGQIQAEGVFVDGARDGEWRAWWEDGRTQKIVEFDHGKELSREYKPRNKLRAEPE